MRKYGLLVIEHQQAKKPRHQKSHTPRFREGAHWVDGVPPREAAFVPPPAEEIPRLIEDWNAFLHSTCENHPMVQKLALAHVQLMTICPFYDRNGRVARALVPMMLREGKMLPEPVLLLSHYLFYHRETYF
jgi:filamentation induced by cAMP protein fic